MIIKVNLISIKKLILVLEKYLIQNFLDGLNAPDESVKKLIEILEKKKLGKKKINFRLKDWGVSRQRYWGCPIPIAYNKNNEILKVPEENLPIKLPENIDLNTNGKSFRSSSRMEKN